MAFRNPTAENIGNFPKYSWSTFFLSYQGYISTVKKNTLSVIDAKLNPLYPLQI